MYMEIEMGSFNLSRLIYAIRYQISYLGFVELRGDLGRVHNVAQGSPIRVINVTFCSEI